MIYQEHIFKGLLNKTYITILRIVINMKSLTVIFLLGLLLISMTPLYFVNADEVVVAVDLSHGESDKYLDRIMGNITWVRWKIITEGFTPDVLSDVDVLLIGQPTVALSPSEMDALTSWFSSGDKAVWVAADSDYGSGPGVQDIANSILEALGSRLRIDLASVEDPVQNAGGRSYRVVANVDPDEPFKGILDKSVVNPVLYHGPAILAYVREDGSWASLAQEAPEGIYRVVRTSPNGVIVENNPPAAKAHTAGDQGSFVLLAFEFVKTGNKVNLVIASGESPYGDYEPTWSNQYYDVPLDGPQFVTNMINFAIYFKGYYNLLSLYTDASAEVQRLSDRVSQLESQVNDLQNQVSSLTNDKNQLQGQVEDLQNQVAKLEDEKNTNLYLGIGVGFVIGIIIGLAVAIFTRRK